MNKVFLMGRLVRDPELRMTATGTPVCSFSLAVDRSFARQGEERKADFFNIVAWRNQAEFCKKYLTKGTKIIVIGSIQNRSWDDQNGQKHYATDIIAEEINFAESKRSDNYTQNSPAMSAPIATPDSGSGFYPIDDDSDMPF
ncbi:MAG: single-stranded DNA-binding protein [Clostridia bacterium]|nr:single-stranded DNA-binding protein [Clostridia bacterium]